MITAKMDMAQLTSEVKKWSRRFGEKSKTATARWAVNTGKECAVMSGVPGKRPGKAVRGLDFGSGDGTQTKQHNAILGDALKVVFVVEGKNSINSPETINRHIEKHRNRKGRTRQAKDGKMPVTKKALLAALKSRRAYSGMAKGGWLGAAQSIAANQKGADRIAVGKNFLGYAQRWSKNGRGKMIGGIFNQAAILTNGTEHSSEQIANVDMREASKRGLQITLSWYRRAVNALDRKK